MLKILQARLQQYMNRELPDVQAGFRNGRGTRDQIANIHWIMEKAREFQKKHLFLLYLLCQSLWLCGWQYIVLMYSFSNLEPICCSMSSSNCCFLTCIQISQEAGQVVWYSHLFKNLPQFIVIHTVEGFGIVNKAEIDVLSGTDLLFKWSVGCW